MQKKNEEIFGFRLFVTIVFIATSEPIKYAPLSPRKILDCGKLNRRNDKRIIICDVKKIVNCKLPLFMFIQAKTIFIIIRFNARRPLKPSIKFAPLIINKKHNNTKMVEKKLLFRRDLRKGISTFEILIGKKNIKINNNKIININLFNGLILIFKSSKKPIKNIE